jgi:hypothetical protein
MVEFPDMLPNQNAVVLIQQRAPRSVLMKTILRSDRIIVPATSVLANLAVSQPLLTQRSLPEVME